MIAAIPKPVETEEPKKKRPKNNKRRTQRVVGSVTKTTGMGVRVACSDRRVEKKNGQMKKESKNEKMGK